MRAYLDGLCGRPHDERVKVTGEVVQGEPAEQIAACVARVGADLLVLATHGAGDDTHYALGRTAARIVEQVGVSILLVPVDVQHPTRHAEVSYRRILVPLDGSARAESSLPIAQVLGRGADVEFLLAHVVAAPDIMPAEPPEPEDLELARTLQRRNEARAQRYLNRLQAQLAAGGVRARAMVLPGPCPRRELAGLLAREHVDLIAVSSHGQSARTEEALGSVASQLVRTHAAPTLVVRGSDVAAAWRRTTTADVDPMRVGPAVR